MGPVTVGADIGQKIDPTAIAVSEVEWRTVDGARVDFHVIRHLERLPLGTSYPLVGARLGEVITGVRKRAAPAPLHLTIYVDATGVGQPVVDILAQVGYKVIPVYFTHGDRRTVEGTGRVTLGKAWLVSRLQALLQSNRILLPRTAEAQDLAKELMDYEIKVSEDANDKYGAFRVGTHDDLVTALGLAVQVVPRAPGSPVVGGERRNLHLTPGAGGSRIPGHISRW